MDDYLKSVLKTYKMPLIEKQIEHYKEKRKDVTERLIEHYKDRIYKPFNSGSYAKHTAINTKFDLDIILPFKYNSFTTLEKMYDEVYEFLNDEFNNEAKIRKQRVSIGLIFNTSSTDYKINLDIVPARETSESDFNESNNLNLYFKENSGLLKQNSYIKTNISSQIEYIKAKDSERKIIRLLKIWKYTNGENYKSFLLELITIKSLESNTLNMDLFQLIMFVLEYIRDNIAKDGFKLIDPGNTNNNVIDSIDDSDRRRFSDKMNTLLLRINEDSDNLRSYFPINEAFLDILEDNDTYGIKGHEIIPSIPPNSQRFGL